MRDRDRKETDKFLAMVGAENLFEYLELRANADADACDLAIKDRRDWAQNQQANPKYRSEAIWIIRNVAMLKRLLITEVDEYRALVHQQRLEPRLAKLEDFLQGVLIAGNLTPVAKDAIRKKGTELEIPEELVEGRLKTLVQELEDPTLQVASDDEETDPAAPVVEVDDDPTSDSVSLVVEEVDEEDIPSLPNFLKKEQEPEEELRDVVRGLSLQGMLQSMRSMVLRKAKNLGLSDADAERIISERNEET